jgi:hypothetical protein
VRGRVGGLMEQAVYECIKGLFFRFLERVCFRGNGDEIFE